MDTQHKELEMMRKEITVEVRGIFKANMKIFDWDIPENDDREAAELILGVMQETVDALLKEVKEGNYDNY